MRSGAETPVVKVPEGKIYDYIDGKFRNDTPEEYVRQTIEKRLVNEHRYQRKQIKIEHPLRIGSRRPRVDIAVFANDSPQLTQDHVWIIVECKSENIQPGHRKHGIEQLKSYMSACPNCEWGMWTNGNYKEVLRKVITQGKIEFQQSNDIPSVDGSAEEVDRPKRHKLKRAYEDNLLLVFKTCHNHIYAIDGLPKGDAFFEFLKVIFCKTLDEQNVGRKVEFYTSSRERANPDGQLTVKTRISRIFKDVKKRYSQIFSENDEIGLAPRSLSWIVSELQSYSLLNTHVDVKGKAYEELVGANLRGDRGEFFTPRNITRMVVKMINPTPSETVCDTACGTGGFLVSAMNHVSDRLRADVENEFGKPRDDWNEDQKQLVQGRIKEIASSNFYGFDINPNLVKATKMNMVMNNDGSGNIFQLNSLLPPHEWYGNSKDQLTKSLDLSRGSITNHRAIGLFDVIVTNPPFGSKIPVKDSPILGQFDLGHIWRPVKNQTGQVRLARSSDLRSSVPPEQLFIERCLQFLKPGGRLAIVLPDSILGNPGLVFIRQWLLERTWIIASIDLHADTFQPRNGTQTSVLIVQKKTQDEIVEEQLSGTMRPYNIFMAVVDRIGHDKRGNTIFKRDEYGDEIWELESQEIHRHDDTADGNTVVATESRRRIIDDQSEEVPEVFARWKKEEGIPW